MSNKQQTALEWFHQKTWNLKIQLELGGISIAEYASTYRALYKQAKEMEKEQIKNAWADGNYNTDDDGNPSENYSISDEHYYEQTYGGN